MAKPNQNTAADAPADVSAAAPVALDPTPIVDENALLRQQLAKLQAENDQLQSDLGTAAATAESAKAELANVKRRIQTDGVPVLPELPSRCVQVLDSVTVPGADGKTAVRANKGDVLTDLEQRDADMLQRDIGKLANVHRIDPSCLQELARDGFIR